MYKLVWVIAFHCLLTVGARADVQVVKPITGTVNIRISGTITERDAKALEALSAELERSLLHVNLNSRGGDVLAAMQIGRLIRKYDGSTWVDWDAADKADAKCYSSCALIFIAGVWRVIGSFGSLGLHRPYLASVPQSRQAVEKQVQLMLAQVKQYVAEMGITDNFYQQMVNTEPSQMVVYGENLSAESAEASKRLGMPIWPSYTKLVPEYDPVYQEVQISYDGRWYGTTTSEMRQREIDAELCRKRKGADSYDCEEALKWGLSERVYRERSTKARECQLDEDQKILLATPLKERRDHPLWIKRETCIRKIMLGGS
jgi:hypothetical protein